MIYWLLFIEFMKIGLFAFGGGLVAVPFLLDLAQAYPWFDAQEVVDMVAISEATPGPLGVNMSTYAGFRAAGISGGIVATTGLIIPALIMMLAVSKLLKYFEGNVWVEAVLSGVRPAVIALILYAGVEVGKMAVVDWKTAGIFAIFFAVIHFYKKSPIFYILIAAVMGVVLRL